jgi:hypothetical protein
MESRVKRLLRVGRAAVGFRRCPIIVGGSMVPPGGVAMVGNITNTGRRGSLMSLSSLFVHLGRVVVQTSGPTMRRSGTLTSIVGARGSQPSIILVDPLAALQRRPPLNQLTRPSGSPVLGFLRHTTTVVPPKTSHRSLTSPNAEALQAVGPNNTVLLEPHDLDTTTLAALPVTWHLRRLARQASRQRFVH